MSVRIRHVWFVLGAFIHALCLVLEVISVKMVFCGSCSVEQCASGSFGAAGKCFLYLLMDLELLCSAVIVRDGGAAARRRQTIKM